MTAVGCFLSVDLEDYKQTTTLEMGVPRRTAPERTAHGVARVLEVLAGAPGERHITFFTTGQVARDQAELVRRLARDGHEIGCHGDVHEDVRDLDPKAFAASLARAVASLEAASGQRILGFRAPNFSIDGASMWALEVLVDAGFAYDSSLVAEGVRGAATAYDIYSFDGRPLFEFPLYRHVLSAGVGVRVIGGTYLRVLPLAVILRLMRRVAAQGYVPMVYIHPADLDDDFDPVRIGEMEGIGHLARWKWAMRQHQWSAGTGRAAWKLAEILKVFPNMGALGEAVPGGGERRGERPQAAATAGVG